MSVYVSHLDFPIRANVNGRRNARSGVLNLTTDGNACFFYCLAAHFHPEKVRKKVESRHALNLKRETKNLYRRVCSSPMETFPGVTMDDMDHLEKKFNVCLDF